MQGIVHHVRIQMTCRARGNLVRGHAFGADAFGIVFGFEIALDHANTILIAQRINGCFQQRSLACAGG